MNIFIFSSKRVYSAMNVLRIISLLFLSIFTSALPKTAVKLYIGNITKAHTNTKPLPSANETLTTRFNPSYTRVPPTIQPYSDKTEKITTETSAEILLSTVKVHKSTKGNVKSARKQNLNSKSSAHGRVSHSGQVLVQEWPGSVECDLPVLPRESRLWRGNETHELNLPVTECGSGEECPPVIVSWEGTADIQSGDILIVRIADAALFDAIQQQSLGNSTLDNSSHAEKESLHRAPQPAVYQVTRQGHEHCDVTDGMLLDITPLDESGDKLITLYDKDLTEGVNFLIVVSESWRKQCVRLKVTVKLDNCGESQECSGKGVCYTNVSMDGYECQCCPGYVGPHCEDQDACHPSRCLNNGICIQTTRAVAAPSYHCLCPYGFTGERCEKDPCSSSPCLNGGSCMSMAMNGSTTFHCACVDGWMGAHCELPVSSGVCASNPCVNGICVEHDESDVEGRSYRCFCQPGYTGDQCELEYNECESSPCANGGTCTDKIGGFECACGRGYTGNTCQFKINLCSPEPCAMRRFCVDRGNTYTCECPRGYIGDECHIPTQSLCDNNPCAHGGTCWSGVDSFYCSCKPGYTGRLCEEDFVLEQVVGSEAVVEDVLEGAGDSGGGGGSSRGGQPGLYHDRLHNVYIAAGTLGAAIAIVGIVVTACHCRVNKTYARLLSRLSRTRSTHVPHHWLQDKRAAPLPTPLPHPAQALDTADMYYTLDFSDSQSSPLIQ